jgi:hypothetical protein
MYQYGPKHVGMQCFKYITVNLWQFVCVCWLKLQQLLKRLSENDFEGWKTCMEQYVASDVNCF